MKRYLSFLLSILLICSVVSACNNTDTSANTLPDTVADEISDATDALTEVLTDTDDEIETSAESKVENETETETEAETEPELESEPDPVAALPPRQVLKSLSVDATPLDISTVCKQISFSNLEFSDVQNAFLKEGYIVASTRRVQSSKLQTTVLKSLGHIVTLMQTDDGTMHVLWEVANEVSVDPLYMDPNMVKGDVTMVQIGIARGDKDDNPMIGMCYVYRLADGTALIIDGGNNNEPCAQNVYATLQKMDIAKDENGKYRITAWIFSHGHGDHYGTFKKFASLYADTTDLAYTFYSFPVGDIAPGGCNAESFAKIISEAYPNAKRVSPHAGLKYYFGNLTVHVLYAPELLYTTEAGVDYYNNTSLILRLEANGQSILHMGDAGEAASEASWNTNESTAFKSTLLQITHHGLYTGNESHVWKYVKKLYKATEAGIALLPMGTRNPFSSRNGRHTVLGTWGNSNYQISFVINKRDHHNGQGLNQEYYNRFIEEIAAGTAEKDTLFGYNGINMIDNGDGLITYINASETEPMATVFTLSSEGLIVVSNTELAAWLAD